MKKKVTYYVISMLFCLTNMITGCSVEEMPRPEQGGKEEREIVNINVSVQTEETPGMTKADIDKGVDGEDPTFWTQYDMRYILEVWKNLSNTSIIIHRDTVTRDDFGGVDFKLQLINGNTYDVLFWADVVKQGSKDDFNYETISTSDGFGLKSIYKHVNKANDNSCDAFTGASNNITINSSTANRSITLSRPVAKLITSGTIGDDLVVDSVVVKYPSINTSYNAYTSKYLEGGEIPYQISQRVTSKEFSIFDYIFVPKDIRDGQTTTINDIMINYSVEFYYNNMQVAKKEIVGIPIGANKKTKVAVNGYTPKTIYKNGDLYTSPDGKYTGLVYNLRTSETDPTSQEFDLVYNTYWGPINYEPAITNIKNLNNNGEKSWIMPTKEDLLILAASIKENKTRYQQNISCIPSNNAYIIGEYADNQINASYTAYWSSSKDNESDDTVYMIWLGTLEETPKVENFKSPTTYLYNGCAVAIHRGHTN